MGKPWCLLSISVLLLAFGSFARAANTPGDRFVESLPERTSVPAEAREIITRTWRDCGDCDQAEFLAQGLALVSEPFREGLDAFDQGDYARCLDIMGRLRNHDDPFVATNAAVYEVKALVQLERPAEALPLIDRLTADGGVDLTAYTYASAEIAFLRGFALLSDLKYDAAMIALEAFLKDFPNASQRLAFSAEQMLAELAARVPGRIGEVVDLMDFSRRRLQGGDAGDLVRERQEKVIDLLDRLTKEAEQTEQQSSGSSSSQQQGGQSPQQQPQQQQQQGRQAQGTPNPSQPMPFSQLPGGSGAEGELRNMRRANPAEAWGSLPPAERERILQAMRESFPSRYRLLVEQYYEELAKKR